MPTATAPTVPAAFRLDGALLARLTWIAHCHGHADVEAFLCDLAEHADCRKCRPVARRAGRPARVPG